MAKRAQQQPLDPWHPDNKVALIEERRRQARHTVAGLLAELQRLTAYIEQNDDIIVEKLADSPAYFHDGYGRMRDEVREFYDYEHETEV